MECVDVWRNGNVIRSDLYCHDEYLKVLNPASTRIFDHNIKRHSYIKYVCRYIFVCPEEWISFTKASR